MANYHETMLGFEWLFSVLSGDATLASFAPGGIWRAYAKPATTAPYVIMAQQAGTDVVTMNGVRIIDDLVFQVKAVGPATQTSLITEAAAQVDLLLGGPPGSPASGTITVNSVAIAQILACYRTSPLQVDELVNGEVWTNVGGLYRIIIEQIAS